MKYSTCVLLGLLSFSSGYDTRHDGSSGNLRTKHHDPSTENRHHSGNGRAMPPPGPEEARQVAPPRPKAAPRQVPPLPEGRIHQHGGARSHDDSPRTIQGDVKEGKKKTRSTGLLNLTDTYDDFEPELVEICSTDASFPIGDDCDVSLYLDDLLETEYDHIFETKCSDDDVIITMDLEDNIPSHVTRMHPYSGHWTELIAVPEAGAFDGCLYFAVVSNADIDPEKETEQLGDEHRRKLSHNGQALGAFHFGQDSFFPFATRSEGRKLQSCSQYNVIRLAIQYDSVFCTDIGGGSAEGAKAAIHSIINTMNKFYQASPLCFTIQSCDIKGYCSASNDPLQGVIESAGRFCGSGDDTLVDTFKAYLNGNQPQGCDTSHLVFGGQHAKFSGIAGCAAMQALCNEHAVGANNMVATRPQMSLVKLLAHELGHNLNLPDFYPQDTTYIMGTGGGDAGFKPERMSTMQDFVNEKRQEDPSCTAVTSQVVDLDTDGLYIKPDVKPGIECAAWKVQGKCDDGWLFATCVTTCTTEGIPVFPDVNPGPDCAARKSQGNCDDGNQYQFSTLVQCSTTCAGGTGGGTTGGGTDGGTTGGETDGGTDGVDTDPPTGGGDDDDDDDYDDDGGEPIPDVESAEDCAYWKGEGNCDDGNQYQPWMLENCSTTCSS